MKKYKLLILALIVLLGFTPLFATDYYVKNGGNDAASGLDDDNAWETIAKVNGESFSGDDIIYFKRGSTWQEQLTIPDSGTSGHQITFGAYGSGAAPIIGDGLVTTWTVKETGDSIFVNGDMENWSSATDLDDATETIAGTSTINREGASQHGGTYAWRADVDAGDSNAYGQYGNTVPIPMTASAAYRFSMWTKHSNANGDQGNWALFDSAGNVYLDTDGTWNAGAIWHDISSTANWTETSIDFTAHASYSGYRFRFGHINSQSDMPSKSIYFDDITIIPRYTNVWQATLALEPDAVFFDGIEGNEQASTVACDTALDWYWASDVLYVYSTSDPDSAYTSPGIYIHSANTIDFNDKDYITLTQLNIKGEVTGDGDSDKLQYCIIEGNADTRHWHFDISSVMQGYAPNTHSQTAAILQLTNGSTTATLKFRDCGAAVWLSNIETSFELQYAYSGSTANIAMLSDTHIGANAAQLTDFNTVTDDIDDNLSSLNVATAFVLGDTVEDDEAEYANYITERDKSDIATWYELMGNHDVSDIGAAPADGFETELGYALCYYSVEIGNIVFVLLSDERTKGEAANTISAAALTFLEGELTDNQDKNIFICTHQGRYNTTRKTLSEDSGYLKPSATIETHLGNYNWDAWFCGHSHGYVVSPNPDYLYIHATNEDAITVSGSSNEIINCTLYNIRIQADEDITITNTIGWNPVGFDVDIADTKTVAGTYNLFQAPVKTNTGTYSDGSSTTLWDTDPLMADPANDDFTLQSSSPCIDAGTDVSLTEDYDGSSVPLRGDMGTSKSFINVGGNLYIIPGAATEGNPDIGAYEYIALYKIGIDGYLYLRLTETHYLRMNQPDFLREYK